MTNFIYDNTGLGAEKTNQRVRPEIPATKKVTAVDWNTIRQALLDTQAFLRGGMWNALEPQAEMPEPSGISNYLWLDTDGVVHVVLDGVDSIIGGSTADDLDIGGNGTNAEPFALKPASLGFVTAKSLGVVADDGTDQRANILAAATTALTLGARLHMGEGAFGVDRHSTNPWCLDFNDMEGLYIHGVKGKTVIYQRPSATNVSTPVIRFNRCRRGGIYDIEIDGRWGNYASEVTWQSDGQNLASGPFTLYVKSTLRSPAAPSTVKVVVGTDIVDVAYTGKTATTFTGCTSTSGTVRSGTTVGYLDVNTGINHTTQADPRSHGIMLRGCEDFEVGNVAINDVYGDAVWIGFTGDPIEDGTQACRNIRLRGVTANMSARHGLSISQAADGVTVRDCEFDYMFGFAVDCEAQGTGQYIRNFGIDGGRYGIWWNPMSRSFFGIAVKGAGVFGLIDGDNTKGCYVKNAYVKGTISAWACRGILIANNTVEIDWDHGEENGSLANIFVDHCDDGVEIVGNHIYSRGAPTEAAADGNPAHSTIVVQSYATALRPGGARIANNHIRVTNGRGGIKASGAGGRLEGDQEFTATSTTATTCVVSGASWTTDEHVGKTIYLGGKVASVAGNNATTLTHTGWFQPAGAGGVQATPTAGAFRMIYPSGVITIEGNEIDCTDDGSGPGGYGVSAYAKLSGCVYRIRNNNVKNATGHAYHLDLSGATPNPLLELVGNYAYDEQETQTTTVGFYLNGMEFVDHKIIYGNFSPDIATHITGLNAGSWQTSNSHPASWAGFEDPNGAIFAHASATYHRIDSKVVYIKQSPESSDVGWQAVQTLPRSVVRGVGTARSTTGTSINLAGYMPPSVTGDIEILIAWTHDASTEPTLGTPASFVKKISGYSTLTFANRPAIFWRRFRSGMSAPVVTVPAGLSGAVVVSLRDVIPYGDPFDDAVFQASPDGDNNITFPAATTTSDDELVLNVLTTYCGGGGATPGTFTGWTNASLTELEEILDARLPLASDIINVSVLAARKVSAGAVSATTATGSDSTQSDGTFTLAFKPAVVPARATGTITCVAKASMADTDYMTIGDGFTPAKVYEFDTAGDGVTGGRIQVNISSDTTAAQVAARLRTAILANQPGLNVVDNADGTLTVTHGWIGSQGNQTMTENVANAGFTVVGLTGGAG